MMAVLWLNTIGEFIIAIGMFSAPGSFFPGADAVGSNIARAFAFAILAVSFISFSATRKNVSQRTRYHVCVILTFYHLAQLLAQFVNMAFLPPLLIPPVVIHTVYSSLFVWCLVKNKPLSTPK